MTEVPVQVAEPAVDYTEFVPVAEAPNLLMMREDVRGTHELSGYPHVALWLDVGPDEDVPVYTYDLGRNGYVRDRNLILNEAYDVVDANDPDAQSLDTGAEFFVDTSDEDDDAGGDGASTRTTGGTKVNLEDDDFFHPLVFVEEAHCIGCITPDCNNCPVPAVRSQSICGHCDTPLHPQVPECSTCFPR